MHDDPRHDRPRPPPEHPRAEPEIFPPDDVRGRRRRDDDPDARVFVYVDREGRTRRMNLATPGPFTIVLILLAVAAIAAVIFALVLGALFFLLPIAAILLASLIAWLYARGLWYRMRGRT